MTGLRRDSMAKIFYDFEFTRLHQHTTPVSLGMITEDGTKQFYAEFTDYDEAQVDEWLKNNVLNLLTLSEKPEGYIQQKSGLTKIKGPVPQVLTMVGGLVEWLKALDSPVTTASFGLSYDDVLFKELFKIANTDIPKNIAPWGYDVCTLLQQCGYDPTISGIKEQIADMEESTNKHNALYDARVARSIYLNLKMS